MEDCECQMDSRVLPIGFEREPRRGRKHWVQTMIQCTSFLFDCLFDCSFEMSVYAFVAVLLIRRIMVKPPSAVLSITGGAQNFSISRRLELAFQHGLQIRCLE
eukprot:SAG31_NODE_1127_length_9758_cov_2.771301_11_plen_103_part_00